MLFGGIRRDSNLDADCHHHPYLEIIDPTNGTCSTSLELDDSIFKHAPKRSKAFIRVRSGTGYEGEGKEGMAFVSDASRGLIGTEVYWLSPCSFRLSVLIIDVEGLLSNVPSSSDLEQRHVQWKDLSPSAAIFSYDSRRIALHNLLAAYPYVSGFRYISPIQPLAPKNLMDPRYFFVYDFNPHREAPDSLPGVLPEEPDPETGYPKVASEITREVVGGLSCWRMRFDLPAAGEEIGERRVALMDGGVVLFEVRCFTIVSESIDVHMRLLKLHRPGEESITVFSIW